VYQHSTKDIKTFKADSIFQHQVMIIQNHESGLEDPFSQIWSHMYMNDSQGCAALKGKCIYFIHISSNRVITYVPHSFS